jgi:translocation and assembly module TamB
MNSGGGTASASGTLVLAQRELRQADMRFSARKFKVADRGLFSGYVDMDARFSGNRDRSLLSGKVVVPEAEVVIPSGGRRPVSDIKVIEVSGKNDLAAIRRSAVAPTNFFSGLFIDGNVYVPGNTWVRGSGLNAEVRGSGRIQKSPRENINITGTIATVRGTFEVSGRLLTIDQGTLIFAGGGRVNPLLNIRASGKAGDITVIVQLNGTLEQPQVSLSSIPPRDESDILSYLLFGRSVNNLSSREGQALQRTTTQVVGSLAARGVKDIIGRELSPDIIDVQGTGGGFVVGKYVTSRLFLKYEWHYVVDNVTQTVLDYQLNRNFSLRSQVGDERNSGLDLFWTKDY